MYSEEYSTIEPSQSEQLYPKSSSGKTQSCRKTLQIAGEVVIEPSCVTGKVAYYALSSILAIGILVSFEQNQTFRNYSMLSVYDYHHHHHHN